MPRYWTSHWQNKFWVDEVNPEFEPLSCAGSSLFRARGVRAGDVLYVISLSAGQLLLGGRMTVRDIVTRAEAIRLTKNDQLYEDAKWWALGNPEQGSPLVLRRALHADVSRQLRFVVAKGPPQGLCFVAPAKLDVQTTRGVRRLTPESARLLDRVIAATDLLAPRKSKLVVRMGDF